MPFAAARTAHGSAAREIVARQFDADADRIDRSNAAVATADCDAQSLHRVRLALHQQATQCAPAATVRLSTRTKGNNQ